MTYREALRQFKAEYWRRVLTDCRGNIKAAARLTGVNRTYLHKVVGEHGLNDVGRPDRKPLIQRKWQNGPRVFGHVKQPKPKRQRGPGSVRALANLKRRIKRERQSFTHT
jgi:hypothetical protein